MTVQNRSLRVRWSVLAAYGVFGLARLASAQAEADGAEAGGVVAAQAAGARAKTAPRCYATTRDLARAYLELERTFAARSDSLNVETLRAVNEGFDDATGYFFMGDYSNAVRAIHEQTDRMALDPELARSCRPFRGLTIDLPLMITWREGRASLQPTLRWLYPPRCETEPRQPVRVCIPEHGYTRSERLRTIVPEPGESLKVALTLPGGNIGKTTLTIITHDGVRCGDNSVFIVPDDCFSDQTGHSGGLSTNIEQFKQDMHAALASAERTHPQLAASIAACRARVNVLTPDDADSSGMYEALDLAAIMFNVRIESAALSRGEDPYKDAVGDFWTVFDTGGATFPLRLYAPRQPESYGPMPLVIALHGAGGDENLWMDGYGAGVLKRIAEVDRFILVSPRISIGSASPEMFDAIVDGVSRWYEIDRSRIYLIGHSRGGGVVTAWSKLRADKVAAACTIAGIGTMTGTHRLPPTLAVAGEMDTLIRPERIRAGVESARAAGLPVEYREYANYGHALVAGKAAREGSAWLMGHRLGEPPAAARSEGQRPR